MTTGHLSKYDLVSRRLNVCIVGNSRTDLRWPICVAAPLAEWCADCTLLCAHVSAVLMPHMLVMLSLAHKYFPCYHVKHLCKSSICATGNLVDMCCQTAAGNLAFPLLLVGGLFLLSRRGGGAGGPGGIGGNNPLQFGKSKAKFQMEPNTGVTFDDVAGVQEAKEDFMEVCGILSALHAASGPAAVACQLKSRMRLYMLPPSVFTLWALLCFEFIHGTASVS